MQHHEEAWIYHGQPEVPRTVRRVKIAENVIKIPDCTFALHRQLEEVILSSSVQVIGKSAFDSCLELKSILYQGQEKEEVGIPSSVKVIDDQAFGDCRRLARLVLNEGLKRIGEEAFCGCRCLTEVEIPSTVNVIDNWAFWRCMRLEQLGLNEGLEQIGKGAFYECESLTEVEIPSSVNVIDSRTFCQCVRLERIALNEGLEEIGSSAFECNSLSHVRIPKSVNSIGTNTFLKCYNLISIELAQECSFNIDLSSCQSLVNLAGPISVFPVESTKSSGSKLGSLVDNEADLLRRLNHRFDNSPLNKLCYYQSYHSYEDAMATLRSLMDENPLAATTQVDEFGMTPLHILSLSQTPNVDMLLAVMKGGQRDHIIFCKDSFGSTPMDYLCLNQMPTSTEVIRTVLEARFAQLLGLDLSLKSEMLQASIDKALAADWPSRRREVVAIYLKLAEQQEILCLLELHLWKTKIDEVTAQEETVDREFCRVNSGASIVLPGVQPFLDEPKADVETYFVSYPDQFEKKKKKRRRRTIYQ
eukprot:scaffold22616_cov90-Cylindrotheca_fusiformis.AAC.1